MYPSSIGSSAGHSISIWNQWSITDSVRTPMASAVWARVANVGPMAAAPPGQVKRGTWMSRCMSSSGRSSRRYRGLAASRASVPDTSPDSAGSRHGPAPTAAADRRLPHASEASRRVAALVLALRATPLMLGSCRDSAAGTGHDHDDGTRHDHHLGADDHDDRAADDRATPRRHFPTTTTTRARPTTTTSHPTTTTTTVGEDHLELQDMGLGAAWRWSSLWRSLLVGLLIARTRRQGREVDWERSVRPAVTAAELARELVLSQTETDDAQRRANVAVQVDEAVEGLERAAAAAPDDDHRALCMRCADSLRGLAFAVEADHLMRSGGADPDAVSSWPPPTPPDGTAPPS